jgi:diaminopimelate decarboxylase/aspartate kinase
VVLRFGPSGLSEPERWQRIAEVIRQRRREGLRPLVVLPALPGMVEHMWKTLGLPGSGPPRPRVLSVTDPHLNLAIDLGFSQTDAKSMLAPELLALGQIAVQHAATRRTDAPAQAQITSFAELLLTRIAVAYLNREGIPAAWLDARTSVNVPRKPGPTPGSELVSGESFLKRLEALPGVVVTQGGLASDSKDRTVRLEPGGADLSAAAFSVWLEAERCEVWTGVPGLFTGDPDHVPSARLLRSIDYAEAQEIVTAGPAVLHPRAIPPLRRNRIPLHLRCLDHPELPGTVVSAAGKGAGPQVKAISVRNGVTLIAMESVEMWREAGFLAEIFNLFNRQGLSIDAVSTSETNITVTLDPGASSEEDESRREKLDKLMTDLRALCEPKMIAPAAVITLAGRGIRAILHELSSVLEVFEEMKIHLITQAASDLNLTFVVDEDQSERLVQQLHGLLFGHLSESAVFGPTWTEMSEGTEAGQP